MIHWPPHPAAWRLRAVAALQLGEDMIGSQVALGQQHQTMIGQIGQFGNNAFVSLPLDRENHLNGFPAP